LNYFATVKNNSPIPRIHPLLLSLAEAFNRNDKSPDMMQVSEDDPRVLSSKDYVPPGEFPPLEIHLFDENSVFYSLTPMAYNHTGR
jgi:hypothetical protein